MGDVGVYGKYAIAVVFIIIGLYLMDIIRLPDTGVKMQPFGMKSVFLSAFSLGLVFGIALGPCTFSFMAPVLGIVFQMSRINVIAGERCFSLSDSDIAVLSLLQVDLLPACKHISIGRIDQMRFSGQSASQDFSSSSVVSIHSLHHKDKGSNNGTIITNPHGFTQTNCTGIV